MSRLSTKQRRARLWRNYWVEEFRYFRTDYPGLRDRALASDMAVHSLQIARGMPPFGLGLRVPGTGVRA